MPIIRGGQRAGLGLKCRIDLNPWVAYSNPVFHSFTHMVWTGYGLHGRLHAG